MIVLNCQTLEHRFLDRNNINLRWFECSKLVKWGYKMQTGINIELNCD